MHRLCRAIGGLVTSLERLDALVFSGGIGENSAVVRSPWYSAAWVSSA